MCQRPPVLLWLRRDLRLSDHPAMAAAIAQGVPVIPVFILDPVFEMLGVAQKWRLQKLLAQLSARFEKRGAKLILRRGAALEQLKSLCRETGAQQVFWTRLYEPETIARDADIKTALRKNGIQTHSLSGHLLFEPWDVATKTGGPYKVFTPFWNAVKSRDVRAVAGDAPANWPAPAQWPDSDPLANWRLCHAMNRGGAVLEHYASPVGEPAAQAQLDHFLRSGIGVYDTARDQMGQAGTSDLSGALAWGEISVRQCWHGALQARETLPGNAGAGAESYARQLVWRDFAHYLLFHSPEMASKCWRPQWQTFPWHTAPERPEFLAWQQARTGVPLVDAGLREMYVTGRMHNRARMIVASYLTKHLMCDWRLGLAWFHDCLLDWDPASNAMGWQWVAGCGPDASPYFRIFNPDTQQKKFDPDGAYVKRWIAQGQANPPDSARAYFDAIPRRWNMRPDQPYPSPVVGLAQGRDAALKAYENKGF